MDNLKQLIQKLGDDPYKILDSSPEVDLTVLRKNYRTLAAKYHPDKNSQQQAKLMFLKINQAYQYLQTQQNRKTYQTYIKMVQQQNQRVRNQSQKRRVYTQNLKRKQQEYLKNKAQMQNLLKKSKQFFMKKMQEAQQRQTIKEQVMKQIGVPQYYELITSINISWRQGLSFTQNLIKSAFKMFGKIQSVKMEAKRNKATIKFNSIQDCTNVVQKFRHPSISIKYQLQKSKRQHYLKALDKQRVQQLDFTLSSQNIQRFKQIYNRGSGIYKYSHSQIN